MPLHAATCMRPPATTKRWHSYMLASGVRQAIRLYPQGLRIGTSPRHDDVFDQGPVNCCMTDEERFCPSHQPSLQQQSSEVFLRTSCWVQLDIINKQELDDLRRCRARLTHSQTIGHPQKDAALQHCRHSLPVLLVDHLLRSGQYLTAHQLARQAGIQVRLNASAESLLIFQLQSSL